jgi:hypothetical protein
MKIGRAVSGMGMGMCHVSCLMLVGTWFVVLLFWEREGGVYGLDGLSWNKKAPADAGALKFCCS